MINVHFSLLPRWRGAAPVERAILAGDSVTGVCVMRLDAGLDTGPVLASRRSWPSAPASMRRLSSSGCRSPGRRLLVDTLAGGVAALGPGRPQEGEPTYAAKLEHGRVPARLGPSRPRRSTGWCASTGPGRRSAASACASSTPAAVLRRATLARSTGSPDRPRNGRGGERRRRVVRCGSGRLELVEVQPAGKRPMAAADWRRGVRLEPGEMFGVESG